MRIFNTQRCSSGYDLVIGNESITTNDAAFGGYMAYFSWVRGVARYTADFTVSNTYPTEPGDLLLTASSFEGTLGSTVENDNVGTTPNVPPGFLTDTTPQPQPIRNWRSLASLYSNNAAVYYKPGSLAAGGVGTVCNSSVKSRRI
jgi:hypothetical protein